MGGKTVSEYMINMVGSSGDNGIEKGRTEDRGFWGRASPGESGKVSGPCDSLGEDHSSLVGHRKELGFYVSCSRSHWRVLTKGVIQPDTVFKESNNHIETSHAI